MKYLKFYPILLLFFQSLSVLSQPTINRIFQQPGATGLYEKLELGLSINAEFTNPFDPDELDIMAAFTAPSGKVWKVPGFYTQSRWGGFLVRFSPDETGEWSYTISVTDRNGTASSETGTFTVVPSEYHGPIRVAQNKRYLEHADGTPWFGVGLWYNRGNDAEVLEELQAKGINFISRLITPLETWGTGLGRYDQMLCQDIDELLEELENRDMQLSLNIWFHSFLSETVWGGGNIAWYTNPYQLVCDAKDFYSSKEAWEYQEKLYRYMIARWGYSRSLVIWFIVDEVNGTDGWASGDSLGAANWARKVHEYFKEHDPWNHLTTGTRSGGIEEWWGRGYEIFDMAGREIYEAQGFPINTTGQVGKDPTHPLTYSYLNYHGQVKRLWDNFEKPAIIPETGWDHTFYEMSMPGYQSQYHNALWVTMASGSAMSPFWWSYSDQLNDNMVTNQLRYFRRFTEQIPFSKLTGLAPLQAENPGGHAFAMGSDQLIFGWAVNADTDMSGKTITLHGIKNGRYRLKLYHTWSGRYLKIDGQEELIISSSRNILSFTIPVLKIEGGHARYIGQDVAFIIELME
ncbi:MAG: hypothetical protein AMS27_06940 [Bacteroides sp. SM23_62_1]|nr:MAG: hypothetical protein AMS27_06940 [Bacteroides sp. SM23_62_1]